MKHTHTFKPGRGSVDVCACGQFRHNAKAGPAIVEQRAGHTPGPWYTSAKDDRYQSIICQETNGKTIAVTYTGNDADARLIAAAPDTAAERDRLLAVNAELVAALEGLLLVHSQHGVKTAIQHYAKAHEKELHLKAREQARAIIEKAKGG